MAHIAVMRVLTVATAALLATLVIEFGLRAIRVLPESIVFDAQLGWALEPGRSGWHMEENAAWISINQHGLYDHEHAIARPPGTVRLAVLGDSFIAPYNLPFEKTFVALFEDELSACQPSPARRVEAINFGVPGYGTAQQLLSYRTRVRAYSADVVVLMMYLGNDILNNHPALNPSGNAPYFFFEGDTLRLVAPAPPAPPAPPESQEALARQHAELPVHQQVRLFITRRSKAAALLYEAWAHLRTGEIGLDTRDPFQEIVYREPARDAPADAWRVTEQLVKMLAAEVAADGAEFWLVISPTAEQANGSEMARRATAAQYGVQSLSYADARVRNLAEANGINAISLSAPFVEFAERNGANLYGGYTSAVPAGAGHWNETGNRVAAATVSRRLCSESLAMTGRYRSKSPTPSTGPAP